jgi:hypothetical protein
MTGRELHARWLGPGFTREDADFYWNLLGFEEIDRWDRLAGDLTADLQAARNDGVIECSEALQDAWDRREQRRCPSTT